MERRYALIGAGGTGTILLEPLVRYLKSNANGDWHLGVIDGDTFESHNEDRQLFHHEAHGINKAEAAVLRVRYAVQGVDQHLSAVPEYLGEENIGNLITDGTYVLIAVDSYRTRAIIEDHARTLDDVTVINGGNEMADGTCQIWMRRDGEDITPPLSFLHPEINSGGADRSLMSCQQIAQLPGGGQLIIANMMSATWMLAALHICLMEPSNPKWTDLTFDLINGKAAGMDGKLPPRLALGMTEIVIGAFLITVIAYTAGFFSGQYISHRRTRELRAMYGEMITSAKYLSKLTADIDRQRHPDE